LPRSYSRVSPRFYSRASPRTFSRALPHTSPGALPQFPHGPNHRSYGLGPQENRFEPRCFGYGPHSHRGDHFPRRLVFPAGGSIPHFESRHLDDPCFTLNDVPLVDRLRYNQLSVSQLRDTDLSVLFRKSDSHVLDSCGKRVCGISRIGNIFQAEFSSAQYSLRCLISKYPSEHSKLHRRLGHLSFDLLC
jgi:hypothetical protein